MPVGEDREDLTCWQCGEVHAGARMVKTADGRQLCSYSKEWLQHCWAMRVLKDCNWAKTKIRKYLEELKLKQRPDTVAWLREELLQQWQHREAEKMRRARK